MLRIACCQLAPCVGDLTHNLAQSVAAVQDAVARGARLVVLPELVTSGYVFDSVQEARAVSIGLDHPVFAAWAAAVAGVDGVVVAGFAERGGDGLLYNSAAIVGGGGVLAVYRKVHLFDREKLIFEPGADLPAVIETPVGRLGVLVCFDIEFPEMPRMLALAGAELVVVPTNWPRGFRPEGERAGEVVIAMAAARVNHVGLVCCDRSGDERGISWNEASCIIDAQGWVQAEADEHGLVLGDLDLALSADKALTPLTDILGDRRPELYGPLVRPASDRAR